MAGTNVTIRMDADLKASADALFAELGLSLSTAVTVFLRQSLREGKIPFEVSLGQPNKETLSAMLEAEKLAKASDADRYTDVEDALRELKR